MRVASEGRARMDGVGQFIGSREQETTADVVEGIAESGEGGRGALDLEVNSSV